MVQGDRRAKPRFARQITGRRPRGRRGMTTLAIVLATVALIDGAAAAAPADKCDVPDSFISSEAYLTNITSAVKAHQRLDISVIGTGSSALPGPDGAHFAYPARLEATLQQMLKGVAPEDFRLSLDDGVSAIETAGADVILMNMQYSPRTDSMLDVGPLADVMRIVAQQHDALLFDRLGLMRSWNDSCTFDLYSTTKNYDMARRVHECIGWALANQIITAGHLGALRMQTTR